MGDMNAIIQPKSDQVNADSLLAGPMTIKVTKVVLTPGTEQPCTVHFEGDEGKPYKPCKSMARILTNAWGPDSAKYVGRSMTIYRDPEVKWAGMKVGGIRISHMSHIDSKMVSSLTASKGNFKPFTVQPLKAEVAPIRAVTPEPDTQPDAQPDAFDWSAFETSVEDALANDAWGPEEIAVWWEDQKPTRVKARAADMARAGKIATRVNAIISKE